MRMEWGADNPAIRQMFANYLMPGATKEQIESFNDLQRKTTSAECAARYFEATGNIDVVELLPQVRVPTLVMHARGDLQVPFELGRQLVREYRAPNLWRCKATITFYWNRIQQRSAASKK